MTVENLEIKVKTDSGSAKSDLDSLKKVLEDLKSLAGKITINSGVQSVGKAAREAKQNTVPLSAELQKVIAEAGRYEVALQKIKDAKRKMDEAFSNGNISAAYSARERELNANAQADKFRPKNPLPISRQEVIETANAVAFLENKIIGLEDAMQEAFANGDENKAWALRGQIIQSERALKKLQDTTDGAAKAQKNLDKSVKSLSETVRSSLPRISKFISSMQRIAFYRFIRSIIKEITDAFAEGLKNAYAFSDGIASEGHRFAAALDSMSTAGLKMKNQLGSLFISLLAAVAPIVNQIIGLVTKLADALSQIISAITGSTYLKAVDVPKKWADNAAKAGKAAKEWKNQLLGFDEINRLEEPSNGGGGGGSSELDPSQMFKDSPISDWAKKIQENLALIELTASGFLLGLGCLLLFSGANIPLGLGLIALGAYGFAKALKEDWSSVDPKIAKAVASVMAILGGALLAIGAVLVFTTANIPLGLGLMAAGAASLGTAVAIHWKGIPDNVKTVLTDIMLALGGALLALGIIITLATPAFSPLGLGLIVAGAASLAAAVAINWKEIPNHVKNILTEVMFIIGGSLVALGMILLLTGAGIPLGLGLILAGAASLGVAYAMNPNAIIETVQNVCRTIWDIVTGLFKGIHDWIQNLIDGITTFFSLASTNKRAEKIQEDGSIYLQGFASGGFPSPGQLFVANEAGPELVGTMGGRTAVAPQNDIVEGIRQGVYDAVTAANSNGERQIDVRVYLDSREIKIGQNRLSRAMGV